MDVSAQIRCGVCEKRLELPVEVPIVELNCPHCASINEVFLFPALWRPQVVERGERRQNEEESACFFHEHKRADAPCSHCGRYLCSLCAIENEGRVVCAECLDAMLQGADRPAPAKECVRYDQIALGLAILSMLFWVIAPFVPPFVLYLVFRHWRTRLSIMPKRRWRFVVAGLLATMQLLFLLVLILSYFSLGDEI